MLTESLQPWKSWQKAGFRFLFLLLGLSTFFCWDLVMYVVLAVFIKGYEPGKIYPPLVKPFHWLDQHIYHTRYDPKLHNPFPEDNHFAIVFYLTLVLLALVGCIIWSVADRKRTSYNRLYYWFRVYIRYVLAIVMFGYGIDKFIPTQMQYPNVISLLTPVGEQTRFDVLWNFMGVSPSYQVFAGAAELLGSLLMLNRRSMVAGALITFFILCNVVAFNIFYNVPVKMFSSQLLIYNLFLIAPFGRRLVLFFWNGELVTLRENYYAPVKPRSKYGLWALLVLIPFLIILFITIAVTRGFAREKEEHRKQKLYEVTSFVVKDTLPPLLTDTLRWRRFAMAYTNRAVVYSMKDAMSWYACDADSVKKTFTLHDSPDSSTWQVLHYEYPAKDQTKRLL